MVSQYAIVVRDAMKQYGNGVSILNGLNLAVSQGSIYGLLGASGCGKTTLLSSVVGVRKLDSGDIWVLGGKPRSKESGIPGPRVGYMPQDVSLVNEFSVIGALYYFGRINGLSDYTIEERYMYLKDLLQLPPKDRLVGDMSGGQQRRLSFAAALLHKPELLILDEPTVGLDPVLRDNIWNHLMKITREEGVTVIITTHYIEEAKNADKIGLMRNGKLLAEASPSEILEKYQTESLEEAFLRLSEMEVQHRSQSVNQTPVSVTEINNILTLDSIYTGYPKNLSQPWQSNSKRRCHALFAKNALQFLRHPGGVSFSIILPILQMMFFFNSTGLDPKNLALSIVNEEAGNCNYGRNQGNVTYDENEFTCRFMDLSCRLINGIDNSSLTKIYYDNYEQAVENIVKEKSIGVMHFKSNFSDATQEKLENYLSMTEENLIASQIDVTLHTPDRQISLFVQKKLYDNFFDKYKEVLKECRISSKLANSPIKLEDPVFGKKDQNYATFVFPPYVLSMLFILGTSVTSSIIITDRDSGVWDRSLVQGVTTAEILITHIISQIIVVTIQVVAALCYCFFVSNIDNEGSVFIVIWLTVLEAVCGMSYGFLISVLCTSHTLVNYAAVGSFYPLLLLCGLIWPIEGMPKSLQWFSLTLPVTVPGISLRAVLEKGSSISEPEVYTGLLVISGWILVFIMICLFRLKTE
ncbi:ABC transporter G family member 20 [Ptiloglossa arizonensis]|uniref:ABC transporter G family member 20 n=1 Tax=Ptiloglossa arizonensis TaxID=3350558 RepID=UPI003F9ED6A4